MIPNSDITIYNEYTDGRGKKYQRAVVRGVVWQATKAISGGKAGALSSNVATVLLPIQRGGDYIRPIAWRALPDKTGKWTLQEGDVIVRGAVVDEIGAVFTMTSLRAKYDDVVTITSVDRMDQGSPNVQHWQVGCR